MPRSPQYGGGHMPKFGRAARAGEPSASATPDLLLRLPTEVLQLISTHLHDFRATYAIYRTCKVLKYATAQSLYSHINFHGWPRAPGGIYFTNARLRAFCVHVLQRPDHAAQVKNLSLAVVFSGTDELDPPLDERCPPTWIDVDEALLMRAEAQARDEAEKLVWQRALRRVQDESLNADAVLALLLPSLPNLRRVFFQMPRCAPFLGRMLDRAAEDAARAHNSGDARPTALVHLSEVVLTYHEDHWGMCPNYFARFLRLPAVRRIRTHFLGTGSGSMGAGDADEQMALLPPGSSACESLEMVRSKLSDADFHKLLAACRSLKILRYEIGWGYLSWSNPTVSALQAAICLHAPSFQELWLDLTERAPIGEDSILYAPMSFGEFKQLRHLKINPAFLLTKEELQAERSYTVEDWDADRPPFTRRIVDRIPENIQRLCFTNLHSGLSAVTEGCIFLLQGSKQTHPRLQELTFEVANDISNARELFLPVQAAAESAQVKFIVRKSNLPRKSGYRPGLGPGWGMEGDCEVPELAGEEQQHNWVQRYPPKWDLFGIPDDVEA